MPRTSMSADDRSERIVIRYSRTNEVCLIFFGALFGLPALWFLPSAAYTDPADFDAKGYAAIAAGVTRLWGPVPMMLLMLAVVFWAVSLGAAALWRLIDRAPALVADRAGIAFHPSVHRKPVAWADVRRVSVEGQPSGLRIALHRRFWSLGFPFTARTVEIKLVGANLTHGAGRDIVKQFNQLRK